MSAFSFTPDPKRILDGNCGLSLQRFNLRPPHTLARYKRDPPLPGSVIIMALGSLYPGEIMYIIGQVQNVSADGEIHIFSGIRLFPHTKIISYCLNNYSPDIKISRANGFIGWTGISELEYWTFPDGYHFPKEKVDQIEAACLEGNEENGFDILKAATFFRTDDARRAAGETRRNIRLLGDQRLPSATWGHVEEMLTGEPHRAPPPRAHRSPSHSQKRRKEGGRRRRTRRTRN